MKIDDAMLEKLWSQFLNEHDIELWHIALSPFVMCKTPSETLNDVFIGYVSGYLAGKAVT